MKVKVAESCLTLCDHMDYTIHGILQSGILEWVALPFSEDPTNPGIKPRSAALQMESLPAEPQGKPSKAIGKATGSLQNNFRTFSTFQDCCCHCPYHHSKTLLTHTSPGDPQDTHRQVLLHLLWGRCSFPLGPGMHKILFVPSNGFCFPQSCGSSVIKSHCLSKLDSLGIPSLFARSPG